MWLLAIDCTSFNSLFIYYDAGHGHRHCLANCLMGSIGMMSGFLGKYFSNIPIYILLIYSIFCGYFYSFTISLTTYQVTGKFWPYYIIALPFDTYQVVGNTVFIVLLYPILSKLMKKYAKDRFHIQT